MDIPDKKTIAGLVKTGRAAKGYTQQELADRTGVTLRSIQRIESGEVVPRAYTLRLLEEQLGIVFGGAAVSGVSEPVVAPGRGPGWSRGRKWIVTIGLALLLPLLTGAYLAQAVRWPATDFERLLIWSGVLVLYSGILWKIWK
jgi:transcriptional regulator with XRE-family HTH domain